VQRGPSVFEKVKGILPYNEIVLHDPVFKRIYQENIREAVYTFPKFRRNYSKNYKSVQMSFRKVSKSKISRVSCLCREKDNSF